MFEFLIKKKKEKAPYLTAHPRAFSFIILLFFFFFFSIDCINLIF